MRDNEPLVADMLAALKWIDTIASANHNQDVKLRSQSARTLKRISDKARQIIAQAEAAGIMEKRTQD